MTTATVPVPTILCAVRHVSYVLCHFLISEYWWAGVVIGLARRHPALQNHMLFLQWPFKPKNLNLGYCLACTWCIAIDWYWRRLRLNGRFFAGIKTAGRGRAGVKKVDSVTLLVTC